MRRNGDNNTGFVDIPITVEIVVVVDESLYNYHGNDTEHYVLTVMKTVSYFYFIKGYSE